MQTTSNEHTPFLRIKAAARYTGLSEYFLRAGCRNGSVPCIRSGQTFFVNIPALLRKLDAVEGRDDE